MSVNDCLCAGAEPLLFLDYVAMSRDDPSLTEKVVQGISDGCVEAECALLGGENGDSSRLLSQGGIRPCRLLSGCRRSQADPRRFRRSGWETRSSAWPARVCTRMVTGLARKLAFEGRGAHTRLLRARAWLHRRRRVFSGRPAFTSGPSRRFIAITGSSGSSTGSPTSRAAA